MFIGLTYINNCYTVATPLGVICFCPEKSAKVRSETKMNKNSPASHKVKTVRKAILQAKQAQSKRRAFTPFFIPPLL